MSRQLIETFLEEHSGKYYKAKELINIFKGKINRGNIYKSLKILVRVEGFEAKIMEAETRDHANVITYYGHKKKIEE